MANKNRLHGGDGILETTASTTARPVLNVVAVEPALHALPGERQPIAAGELAGRQEIRNTSAPPFRQQRQRLTAALTTERVNQPSHLGLKASKALPDIVQFGLRAVPESFDSR